MKIYKRHLFYIFLTLIALQEQHVNAQCNIDCRQNATCVEGSANFDDHDEHTNGTAFEMHSILDINGYHCECPLGWTGVLCDEMYVACDGFKCYNGGVCMADKLDCDCSDTKDANGIPYVGKFCEEQQGVVQCGPDGMFCTNGGECPTGDKTVCECGGKYFGRHCELEGNESDDNGMSSNVAGDIDDMDDDMDDGMYDDMNEDDQMYVACDQDHKCHNGGECIPGLSDHHEDNQLYCDCSSAKDEEGIPYVGKFCEYKSEVMCGSDGIFCTHGGECPTNGKTACDCSGNYFGPHCQYEKKEDANVPECTLECENEGACVLGGSDDTTGINDLDHLYKTSTGSPEDFMSCVCPTGYGGKYCDIEMTECGSHHCYHGGICLNKLDSNNVAKHRCDCTTAVTSDKSYAGRFCQLESSAFCSNDNRQNGRLFCVNGGTCLADASEGCECPVDFYGHSCEFKRVSANSTTVEVSDSIDMPDPVEDRNGESESVGLEPANMSTHPGAEMCNKDKPFPTQPRSFCLHGGKCKAIITEPQIHPGCTCSGDWVGPHCEIRSPSSVVSTVIDEMQSSSSYTESSDVMTTDPDRNAPIVIREEGQNGSTAFLAIGCSILAISLAIAAWIFVRDRDFRRELDQRDGILITGSGASRRRSNESRRGSNESRRRGSNESPAQQVNLAAGEQEVYIGPPRDEDGHELHNVSLFA